MNERGAVSTIKSKGRYSIDSAKLRQLSIPSNPRVDTAAPRQRSRLPALSAPSNLKVDAATTLERTCQKIQR